MISLTPHTESVPFALMRELHWPTALTFPADCPDLTPSETLFYQRLAWTEPCKFSESTLRLLTFMPAAICFIAWSPPFPFRWIRFKPLVACSYQCFWFFACSYQFLVVFAPFRSVFVWTVSESLHRFLRSLLLVWVLEGSFWLCPATILFPVTACLFPWTPLSFRTDPSSSCTSC